VRGMHARKIMLLIALMVAIVLSAVYTPEALANMGVKIAVEYNIHPLAAFIAMEKGIFAKNGVYIGSFKVYRTGLQITSALVRGDADAAFICLSPAILAYARGAKIKIVCLTHLYGYALVASPRIEKVRDLNGELVGTMKMGSPLDLLYQMVKRKYGLIVRLRRMSPLRQLIALERGDLKAAFLSEPFAAMAVEKGFHYLLKAKDIWPGMNGSVLVARENYIRKYPKVIKGLVKSLKDANALIHENPLEAARCAQKYIGVPAKTVVKALNNIVYTTELNQVQLEKTVFLMKKLGYIPRNLEVDKLLLKEN